MTQPVEKGGRLEGDRHKAMAAAMGRIPSGLFIVTVQHGASETGMLASWIQQCSFEPPMVSMAIRQDREVNAWLPQGTVFTLNILDETQTDMIVHFGRGFALEEPAFTGLEVQRPDGGPPVLTDSLAYLECKVAGHHMAGDHHLYLAQVIGGRVLDEGKPMVHVRKSGLHY
jgi:flavin reductase (DIM6/NTAB) family NADH-FMN oxidoreductase RutF